MSYFCASTKARRDWLRCFSLSLKPGLMYLATWRKREREVSFCSGPLCLVYEVLAAWTKAVSVLHAWLVQLNCCGQCLNCLNCFCSSMSKTLLAAIFWIWVVCFPDRHVTAYTLWLCWVVAALWHQPLDWVWKLSELLPDFGHTSYKWY